MGLYTYPDKYDELTIQFIKEKENDDKYWEESENSIINHVISYFKTHLHCEFRRFLDAGCGSGRLIPKFEHFFQEIVAIEPDFQRYEKTREMVKKSGIEQKTQIHQVFLEEFSAVANKQFDFILCSHVIQHIHSYSVNPFLIDLKELLDEKGILAITTSHSVRPFNYFIKSYCKNGVIDNDEITEDEYNELSSFEGVLPVQLFNGDILTDFLCSVGLKLLDFRIFHIEKSDRLSFNTENPDFYFNVTKERQKKYGIDMLILMQKTYLKNSFATKTPKHKDAQSIEK